MKYLILFFSSFLIIHFSFAQEVLENNPPSIKWYRVNTPNFKVLYPKGFEQEAQRMANTLEHIRTAESKSLGKKTKRISVILQNQSSISNGFVSLIPKRSEFYTMPPQDYNFGGTNDWLNQLATHEFRHVVQYDNAKTGFNKVLYYMFGHATLAAMAHVSAPSWFWEGDAVAVETAFTHSGRGRIPNFDLLLRTNFQEGRVFNYHKQYLQSYKHNISDHYVLGYHMVGYLRKRTGDPDIWGKITKRAWSVPFIPFAFSNAIKKESGLYVTDLFKEMAVDLQKTWSEENASLDITPFEKLTTRKSGRYTSYSYPQELNDGGVLTMKSGIGDITQFVVIKDGKEDGVFIPGIVNDAGMLSASGTKVVWNEFGFDPRWRVKNYSLIKAYDMATNRYWTVTQKSRYSAASLSPDGKWVVAVESNENYAVSLVVIDIESGAEVKKFTNPENVFYSMPRWSSDGKKIVVLKTKNTDRSVVSVDYETGSETVLLAPSKENIGHPVLSGNFLFYNSPVSGIDNIFAYDIQAEKKMQVTSSKYGAYNPNFSADGKRIYYNEQTRDGFDVVAIPFDSTLWKEISIKKSKGYDAYLTEQEGRPTLFDSIPNQEYATKKYSKISGVMNPYSWGAYFNSSLTQVDIGINSQDILSTTAIKAGYLFDIYERTGAWRVGLSYQNWFPIIDLNFTAADRSVNEGNITYDKVIVNEPPLENDTLFNTTENLTFTWKERTIETGLRIPLLTTHSKFYSEFSVSNYVGITKITQFENSIDGGGRLLPSNYPQYFFRSYLENGTLLYNRFNMSAYRLLKQSKRDINSKWGQTMNLVWHSTPYGGDYKAKQFSFYSLLYFPGLFKHHSLWGYWAYQSTYIPQAYLSGEGLDSYLFSNQIPLPRGISSYIGRFQKMYTMSANYTLPVWYPDVAIGPILNIQRVRINGFADYGFGSSEFGDNVYADTFLSVGGEVKFDINIFRFLPQFDIGVRYSYGLKPSVTNIEFLIGAANF